MSEIAPLELSPCQVIAVLEAWRVGALISDPVSLDDSLGNHNYKYTTQAGKIKGAIF